MMSRSDLAAWMENHPKLLGKLLTFVLLLSQAGSAVAANGGTIS